ncbi:MAG: histidine--tRNA ligase [Alphaproteobacteria bacterium]|nr:histidine--tRNA ligase [Alphaproteobacteria bacterium]
MSRTLQTVRGTQDLLPAAMRRHRAVVETARVHAPRFGYEEIATPIFEFTDVFSRPIGETTDIVMKEMYTFADKGGEEVTLRPEYTAGIIRAVISNGLTQSLPLRFFASGPMFRYERPQKGRFRQFHQIDAELIGVKEPQGDVEVIALGADILGALGVLSRAELHLNTLGDADSRRGYRDALVGYFTQHAHKLSEDSRRRLERNPLRILDSKDEADIALSAAAPHFEEYLTPASREFFGQVRAGLDALGIRYKLDPRLVRGLDYYTHTAFEFVTTELGSQGAVLAGGRYDGLMGVMGGPETPGVGWAAGIERLALMIAEPAPPPRTIALVPIGAEGEAVAFKLAQDLRRDGFAVDLAYSGNLQKRMRRADRLKARAAVIIGDDELKRGQAAVRDLDTGAQSDVPLGALKERLASFRG